MSTERDDTTRYLCAAAHLDDRFADRVIDEFLTEPTRAVPPVAGVRAGVVLAEAVAARARRKIRDTVLVALFCCVLVTLSISLVAAWLIIGVTVLVSAGVVVGNTLDRTYVLRWLGGVLVAAALLVVLFATGGASTGHGSPAAALAVLLLVLLLAVLLVDEFVVWRHVVDRFRRDCVLPDPHPDILSPQARRVYLFGSRHFLTQLRRHLNPRPRMRPPTSGELLAANGEKPVPAPVTVARGHRVFVGAGEPYGQWTLALPLRQCPALKRVTPLSAAGLYARVEQEMDALRNAAHLSPGGRFAELRVTAQVVVAADELIDNLGQAKDFLAEPTVAPYPLLRGQRVRELRDRPLEWARYYLRVQVETWHRDFVVSVFLHLAVSDTTLYVEWTPCVLLPVRKEYRAIDSMPDSPLLPVVRAVLRFFALPLTMPARLRTACSVIRPKRRSPGVLTPDMYGVAHSLRELAADTDVQNYFQLVDRDRYLKVLESRLRPALVTALAEAGYEVADRGTAAGLVTTTGALS
ncbi:hypothetical protein [Actinophytocola sp.]|uniref:hypothetical protein n=1 Tax=Actinophytocola sp. TaxID=1872138 RepID=UPI002ED5D5F0